MTKVKTSDQISIYRQIYAKLESGTWTDKDVSKFLRHEKAMTSFYEAIKSKDPVYEAGTMPSQDDIRKEGPCRRR